MSKKKNTQDAFDLLFKLDDELILPPPDAQSREDLKKRLGLSESGTRYRLRKYIKAGLIEKLGDYIHYNETGRRTGARVSYYRVTKAGLEAIANGFKNPKPKSTK